MKTAEYGDNLPGEAAALRWLAEAEKNGGIRIVRVISVSEDELVEERVQTGVPSVAAARRTGAALARTHAAGAPWYGCAPEGWTGEPWCGRARTHAAGAPWYGCAPEGWTGEPWCGRARTPYVAREDAASSWGAFFAEHRIMNYVRDLVDSGEFGPSELQLFGRVAARLAAGEFDAPQPELVRAAGVPCARLHGDLWSGNVLWDGDPEALMGSVLIDPMAYGGHAETDLAMLALFGHPLLEEVLLGYDEASPLADGWRERVGLHQLAPLLLHCVLFGGWYLGEAVAMARRYA